MLEEEFKKEVDNFQLGKREEKTEEEEFAEYFLDNMTLDNGQNKRKNIVNDYFRKIREARKKVPPSRYMKGEDFTYSFKKLY